MSLSEPGPTPSTDIELVEAVRDALISTLILLCKDMTIEQVEALARAAVAAMPLPSREAVLGEENARLREEATRYRALYERSKLPPRSKKSLSPDGGRDGE